MQRILVDNQTKQDVENLEKEHSEFRDKFREELLLYSSSWSALTTKLKEKIRMHLPKEAHINNPKIIDVFIHQLDCEIITYKELTIEYDL